MEAVWLANGAKLIAPRINGRGVPLHGGENGSDARLSLGLPWPDENWATGELTYACPAKAWRFAANLKAALPEFALPLPVRWGWRIPDRMTPLPPQGWHAIASGNG